MQHDSHSEVLPAVNESAPTVGVAVCARGLGRFAGGPNSSLAIVNVDYQKKSAAFYDQSDVTI